ncbi:MAG: 30S ribosomal protein S11 [Patescibacteria group bacterium]|jgi:small subunit ribosomal protein S11
MAEEKKSKTDTAEVAEKKPAKAARGRKSKQARQVRQGQAHIQATYNNTVVTLTDLNGNVISWSSAGRVGFRGPKKSTPYAAGIIVKDAVERCKAFGLQEVSVFVKGVGSGREAAIRALHANNIAVSAIRDITPIPHNGCRRPRPRRV